MGYLYRTNQYLPESISRKVVVRKLRSIWVADCPCCPPDKGFVTRPTQGLALAWALGHAATHGQKLMNIERRASA